MSSCLHSIFAQWELRHPSCRTTQGPIGYTIPQMAKSKLKLSDEGSSGDAVVDGIINDIRFDRADSIVMIGIPSHERTNARLAQGKQSEYATAAMEKFADLFGGATALRSYRGIYKSDNGKYLWDDTILIQAFTSPDNLQNAATVKDVVVFARKMRKDLNQETVMVVFNNMMRFIKAER